MTEAFCRLLAWPDVVWPVRGPAGDLRCVQGTIWQGCLVNFMRNALTHVPRRQHQMVAVVTHTARAGGPDVGTGPMARDGRKVA